MSAYSNIDRETFNWVRSEVDVTVGTVRRELQKFVTSDDKQDLDDLVNHLHQVVGSLQMIELKSLSTLMIESELLLENFIAPDSGIEKTSFCKLFESSLNVLDSSFARIDKGLPESPIEVVELINRIRELRGEEHVEISALFSPMIEIYPEVNSQRALKDQEYIKRATALRKLYQVYLLEWLRNADAKAVQRIRLVFEKLSQMSTFGSVSRIWWVATAYVDYLENNKLKNRLVHGRILRELDDHLRSLELQGESALVRDPGEELIKVMLFYIAMGETRTEKMNEIVNNIY